MAAPGKILAENTGRIWHSLDAKNLNADGDFIGYSAVKKTQAKTVSMIEIYKQETGSEWQFALQKSIDDANIQNETDM